MKNKLFTLEKRVEFFLKEIPATRDNDMLLAAMFYQNYYGTSDLLTLIEWSAPTYESISRCRRKIQARGEYLPSEDASAWRKAHYKDVLDYVKGLNNNE